MYGVEQSWATGEEEGSVNLRGGESSVQNPGPVEGKFDHFRISKGRLFSSVKKF